MPSSSRGEKCRRSEDKRKPTLRRRRLGHDDGRGRESGLVHTTREPEDRDSFNQTDGRINPSSPSLAAQTARGPFILRAHNGTSVSFRSRPTDVRTTTPPSPSRSGSLSPRRRRFVPNYRSPTHCARSVSEANRIRPVDAHTHLGRSVLTTIGRLRPEDVLLLLRLRPRPSPPCSLDPPEELLPRRRLVGNDNSIGGRQPADRKQLASFRSVVRRPAGITGRGGGWGDARGRACGRRTITGVLR